MSAPSDPAAFAIRLCAAIYVLAYLALVGAPQGVEHVDGDDAFGGAWRRWTMGDA